MAEVQLQAGILNFAHRGASGTCPENTMAAFRKAAAIGANGIETDVQMTRDGELVLIHDETLKRTTGAKGWVKDWSYEELQRLDAGSWFKEEFRGERIPLLRELLELVVHRSITLNIELKNSIVPYPGLEEKVIQEVRRYGLEDRVLLSSFDHYSLVRCKAVAPYIRTGLLYSEPLYEPWWHAQRVGATALHPNKRAVRPEWVAEAAQHGLVYYPYTVNDPVEMERMLRAGVAGMFTDYPERLAELLDRLYR